MEQFWRSVADGAPLRSSVLQILRLAHGADTDPGSAAGTKVHEDRSEILVQENIVRLDVSVSEGRRGCVEFSHC